MGNEKNIGNSQMKGSPRDKFKFTLTDQALKKIAAEARHELTPDLKALEEAMKAKDAELQHQINAAMQHGVAVSNRFGNNDYISISQRTLTIALNQIWKKLADITGEVSIGLRVTVTPDTFVNDDSADITITATAGDGIFEALRIYINDELFIDKENIQAFTTTAKLSETSVIHTVATILGMDYEDTHIVTKVFPFFIGCGQEYEDILNKQNARQYNGDLTGSYDIRVDNDGDRIFIVIPASLRDQVRKINIGGELVPAITMNNFTIPMEVINVDVYTIYRSLNQYQRGLYNVDIN